MSERKLRAWQEAGLIDEAAVASILAFEEQHERPLGLWAAIGIGALAIGLGIVSIVAANWEAVPGAVRLSLHLALIAGLGGFIALRGERMVADHSWWLEASLFVLAVLGMAFFGHLGQVYQTSAPLYVPLAAWLILFGPLLLMRGQSWLAAALVFGTLAFACWDFAWTIDQPFDPRPRPPVPLVALVTALPVMFAPTGAWMRDRAMNDVFWQRLEEFALAYALGAASLVCIAASIDTFGREGPTLAGLAIRAGVALLAAALLVVVRRDRSGQGAALTLGAAGIAALLAHPLSGIGIAPGLLFMALWFGVGLCALKAGWRAVFQIAVAMVALRLIALSFELASDLLTSGFGLILAGVLILVVAWGAVRVSRTFAPGKGDAA